MLTLPSSVVNQYDTVLKSLMIPINQYPDYKKWLRYFLDFCSKYVAEMSNTSERMQLFLEKLREKKQSEEKIKQAGHAITLYYDMQGRAGDEFASKSHEGILFHHVQHRMSLPDKNRNISENVQDHRIIPMLGIR